MKKILLLVTGLILVGLVYSFETAKGNANDVSQNMASEYIIIKYTPSSNADVVVYSGETNIQHFELTPEQKKDFGTFNLVIDLLNKYSAQGYTIVSSAEFHVGGTVNGTQCILKKTK